MRSKMIPDPQKRINMVMSAALARADRRAVGEYIRVNMEKLADAAEKANA